MVEPDLAFVDEAVARIGREREAVLPLLQAIQDHYRYVPQEAIARVCELTAIAAADIVGVATFYDQFRHRPVGRHIIRVCHGTACHVKGADVVQAAFERHLRIADGDDTDPEGEFTVQKVACLGCCTLAPVVQIGDRTYGHLSPSSVGDVLKDFLQQQKAGTKEQRRPETAVAEASHGEIRVGLGSCCIAQGSGQVYRAIEATLAESGASATLKRVGCVGMCHQTPMVQLRSAGKSEEKIFAKVNAESAGEIVLDYFRPRGLWKQLRYKASRWLDRLLTDEWHDTMVRHSLEVRDGPVCEFLGPQQHLATEYGGQLDPLDLEEYLRHDGFRALQRCLASMRPEQIIEEIHHSGLRGRGGAGYPTGLKWAKVRAASGGKKYVVCNGDEGDPGAFMDRMLLESFPYRIIEGMAIAARAVGAEEGFFYIRAEYPLAVERVNEALRKAREHGFLGERILGTEFGFELTIKQGAGAFVCGEETALLASIEGRRGMPRLRPPYPAEQGLWGRPTAVNNVETYTLVPWIVTHGAEAFRRTGRPDNAGTKVFALAGKVRRGGLIEVPMGVTLRQIVEQIGGGVADAPCRGMGTSGGPRRLKAIQIGGPSGGCIPAGLVDIPVDYDCLAEAGAIMGSGGLVVLDDRDCMVDIARYFLQFTQNQSCGKCTLCRIGTRRMLEMLERICGGHGEKKDLDDLEKLARTVQAGSICGLGRTAPNPVLSTLRHFREEYEAHIAGHCPAGKCKALISYRVTAECIGCTLCAQHCPVDAITATPYIVHRIDRAKCTRCDTCRQVCPRGAIVVESTGTVA